MTPRDPFYPNQPVTHPTSQIPQILWVSTNQNSSLSLNSEVLLTCPTCQWWDLWEIIDRPNQKQQLLKELNWDSDFH